jgi:hypothetical protein
LPKLINSFETEQMTHTARNAFLAITPRYKHPHKNNERCLEPAQFVSEVSLCLPIDEEGRESSFPAPSRIAIQRSDASQLMGVRAVKSETISRRQAYDEIRNRNRATIG